VKFLSIKEGSSSVKQSASPKNEAMKTLSSGKLSEYLQLCVLKYLAQIQGLSSVFSPSRLQ